MDGLTDIVFGNETDDSLNMAEEAHSVFHAVAKGDPVSVPELLAVTGMQESALRDALSFLTGKGFIKDFVGLTTSGRTLATRVFPDHSAPSAVMVSEAVNKARAVVRLKSTFSRDYVDRFDTPEVVTRDWTMPPDRNDLRRFASNPFAEVPAEGIAETIDTTLHYLMQVSASTVKSTARATHRHEKAVAEDMADLAALGLIVDVSSDAEARAQDWQAFCLQVLAVLDDGLARPVSVVRDMVPASEFSEVKAALRYLAVRGEAKLSRRGGQKVYSNPTADGSSTRMENRATAGSQRGPNWSRIEELVSQGPITQPELAVELGLSSERVRQITEILVAEGRIRLCNLKGKGRTRCFVSPDFDDDTVDMVLSLAGFERVLDKVSAEENSGTDYTAYPVRSGDHYIL